ncbi:MAG: flagellar assembly protein FliW [Ruminiclostridium sp.]|nr:flagellar assembly protein FliW [Ruminiclostridium sp.]
MQLQTRNFGEITVNESDVIVFPSGLPGFEEMKKFTLLGKQDTGAVFFWLQSIDEPNLSFVVTDPFAIHPEYFVDVDDSETQELQISDAEDLLTLAIVTVPENVKNTTVNLKAPVLINLHNNKGKQIIMKNETFPVKYNIMNE